MTRVAPNRFDPLEYDRWAEPLDENFARVSDAKSFPVAANRQDRRLSMAG